MTALWKHWFCLGVLRFQLSPVQFWQMSLCEWRVLMATVLSASDTALDRGSLQVLCLRFPDEAP